MSYGPPPKTPYGDQDFIKEEWNPQSTPPPPPTRVVQPPMSNLGGPGGPPLAQSMPPGAPGSVYGNNQTTTGAMQAFDPRALAETARSLTQDDIIFTRQWRQDSFYYRVLPLTAIATGAFYYYNKMKGLPQKISRFVLVGGACYVVGKWSYRDELIRRLEASPSQTPYMQTLRAAMGLKPATTGFVSENSQDMMYGDTTHHYTDSYGQTGFPAAQPLSSDYPQGSTNQTSNYPSSSLYDSNSDDLSNKPTTSYEELRARNRGFVPK